MKMAIEPGASVETLSFEKALASHPFLFSATNVAGGLTGLVGYRRSFFGGIHYCHAPEKYDNNMNME
jgi:hypothetical protein